MIENVLSVMPYAELNIRLLTDRLSPRFIENIDRFTKQH